MTTDQEISTSKSSGIIARDEIIHLLNRALSTGNFRFIRTVCKQWLEKYPNDITIQCFLVRSSVHEEDREKNIEIINDIQCKDPENSWAWEIGLKYHLYRHAEDQKFIKTVLYVLGKDFPCNEIHDWGKKLKVFNYSLQNASSWTKKEQLQMLLNTEEMVTPLAGIYHLYYAKKIEDKNTFQTLANRYHHIWPKCIAISLWLADSLIESDRETEAVSILHSCAALDSAGEVINRLWGSKSEFNAMWNDEMAIQFSIPIPQQVAMPIRWNQLTSGENNTSDIKEKGKVHDKRNRLIENINFLPKKYKKMGTEKLKNGESESKLCYQDQEKYLSEFIQSSELKFKKNGIYRKPVYVILSIKSRLDKKYGEKSSLVIRNELKKLAESAMLNPGWYSIVFYPDDINCMRLFDLDPLIEIDPWKIKLALVDLDKYLDTKGQMIGSLLIVGGGDVVPFHSLPNPTDDKDKEVLSDNPYATLDANYFVPEWPMGRLPGERSNDPGLLLKQIRQITVENRSKYKITPWWQNILECVLKFTNPIKLLQNFINRPENYGYTASVWRRSSLATFRPIGAGSNLRVTPPFNSENLDIDLLKKSKLAYFNLHGLPDSPEWYGQRDIGEDVSGPDFPIAISTNQLNTDSAPFVVFSEACYGAFVENKNSDESIALKFKEAGTSVFIGSTCISYGSINTPLIGADLLAFIFWKYLLDGFTSGEAFMRAKISFAQVMMQRQGYLDGEDQKILLSFVYFGDPLAKLTREQAVSKSVIRSKEIIKVTTVCDEQDNLAANENRLSGEILGKIKDELKEYLPGIDMAEMKIHPLQLLNEKIKSEFGESQTILQTMGGNTKITYYQPFISAKNSHFQYARVTINREGKMVKLVISR